MSRASRGEAFGRRKAVRRLAAPIPSPTIATAASSAKKRSVRCSVASKHC